MDLTNFEKKLLILGLCEYETKLKGERQRLSEILPFTQSITYGLIEKRLEEIEKLQEKIKKVIDK